MGRKINSGEPREEASNPFRQKRGTPELSSEVISQLHEARGGEGLTTSLSKAQRWAIASGTVDFRTRGSVLRFRRLAGLVPVSSSARRGGVLQSWLSLSTFPMKRTGLEGDLPERLIQLFTPPIPFVCLF